MPYDSVQRMVETLEKKPHGTRVRYMQGCCLPCRAANTNYETHRALKRLQGKSNRLVASTDVRLHLVKLSRAGVGRRQVAKLTGVGETILADIKNGRRDNIREQSAEKILAVRPYHFARGQKVAAGPTWKLIDWLLDHGYTKRELARRLGSTAKNPALQLHRDYVTVENALKVKRLYDYHQ